MTSTPNPNARARRWSELLLWCLPALLLGGWLRIELLAGWKAGLYFGPDSGSYWESAFRVTQGGAWDIAGKRPWLYPWLVWLGSFGPISPAWTIAALQQAASWASILALGGCLRRILPQWKWLIVPATVLYGVHPELLYWGHVLIADSLFISISVAIGWVAVVYWQEPRWRWLFVAAALIFVAMALRPVGRALWLSLLPVALLTRGQPWKWRLAHAAALLALYFPASKATEVSQGEDLLFVSTLPLMRLDTPLHAAFKAELRPQVEQARADLWQYVTVGQRQVWGDLIDDTPENPNTILQQLRADKKRYSQVRREISREALRHAPFRYATMVAMKMYSVYGINDSHERLAPERWGSAMEKFLNRTFQKIDPKFPGFVLGDPAIVDAATLQKAIQDSLTNTGSQSRVQAALDTATRLTAPFSLQGAWPDRWPWIVLAGLGVLLFPWGRDGHRLVPLLILAAGYLTMTYLVGRAVGRYRLPMEFVLYVSAAAGVVAPLQIWKRRKHD